MTLLNESRAADLQIRWAELAVESAQLQYDIAVSESSDGVLTESENEYLFMEAEQAAQKSKNIILIAIDKVIEFIKSIASKIAAAFSEKKVKDDVNKIEKIKNDKDAKSIKVEVPDWKDAEKNVKDYEKAIADVEKKANAGKLTQADIDKMNNAKTKCSSKKKMIVVGAISAATLIAGYVASSRAVTNKVEEDLDRLFKKCSQDTDKANSRAEHELDSINGDPNLDYTVRSLKRDINDERYHLDINKANLEKKRGELQLMYCSMWGKIMRVLNPIYAKNFGKSDMMNDIFRLEKDVKDGEDSIDQFTKALDNHRSNKSTEN